MSVHPAVGDVDVAALLLRTVLGPLLILHGYVKIADGALPRVAEYFESIGLRPGRFHAVLTTVCLVVTGACLVLGLFTAFAGLGVVGVMGVAFWTARRGNGPLVHKGGWEYCAVLATAGVTLAVLGPGAVSVDRVLGVDINGLAGLVVSAVGGTAAATAVVLVFHRPVRETVRQR